MIARFASLTGAERAERFSPFERAAMLPAEARRAYVASLTPEQREALARWGGGLSREAQRPPTGEWRTWLVMAGAASARAGRAPNGCSIWLRRRASGSRWSGRPRTRRGR